LMRSMGATAVLEIVAEIPPLRKVFKKFFSPFADEVTMARAGEDFFIFITY